MVLADEEDGVLAEGLVEGVEVDAVPVVVAVGHAPAPEGRGQEEDALASGFRIGTGEEGLCIRDPRRIEEIVDPGQSGRNHGPAFDPEDLGVHVAQGLGSADRIGVVAVGVREVRRPPLPEARIADVLEPRSGVPRLDDRVIPVDGEGIEEDEVVVDDDRPRRAHEPGEPERGLAIRHRLGAEGVEEVEALVEAALDHPVADRPQIPLKAGAGLGGEEDRPAPVRVERERSAIGGDEAGALHCAPRPGGEEPRPRPKRGGGGRTGEGEDAQDELGFDRPDPRLDHVGAAVRIVEEGAGGVVEGAQKGEVASDAMPALSVEGRDPPRRIRHGLALLEVRHIDREAPGIGIEPMRFDGVAAVALASEDESRRGRFHDRVHVHLVVRSARSPFAGSNPGRDADIDAQEDALPGDADDLEAGGGQGREDTSDHRNEQGPFPTTEPPMIIRGRGRAAPERAPITKRLRIGAPSRKSALHDGSAARMDTLNA